MASITGNRIRELKGRDKARPLIFQPKTDIDTALERHEEAYQWLGADKKASLSQRLWRDLIDLLSPIKTIKARQAAFMAFIAQEWENPRYRSYEERQAILTQEEQEKGRKDFEDFTEGLKVSNVFADYAAHFSSTKLFPKLPGKPSEEIQYQAIYSGESDAQGNRLGLFSDELSKVPKPFYEDYLKSLTGQDLATAKKLVRRMQDLGRFGRLWSEFLKAHGVTVKDMDHTHSEYYPAWRKGHRLPGNGCKESEKPVGIRTIKKEVLFFKQVTRYAIAKRIITFDPSITLKVDVTEHRKITDKEKPLDLTTLRKLLSFMKKTLEGIDTEDSTGQETLLNIQTIYFFLLTGCRPSEVKNYTINEDHLHLNPEGTGKTKQAVRALPLTPRLQEIAEDPILERNRDTPDVSTRINQWLDRRGISINPYRFRHTCATILLVIGELPLQEIAYRMGHSDSGFTQRVYGNMGVHLKSGKKEAVKAFWKELNGL